MKKKFIVGIAAIFVMSMIGFAGAQEKVEKGKPAEANKAAVAKAPAVKSPTEGKEKGKTEERKAAAVKPQTLRAGGVVKEVDLKTKVLTIHQESVKHDWYIKLKVSEGAAKELTGLKPGDLVNIWIKGQLITTINKLN